MLIAKYIITKIVICAFIPIGNFLKKNPYISIYYDCLIYPIRE